MAHEFPKSCEKIKICINRRPKLSSLSHELETLYIDSVAATEELDRISILHIHCCSCRFVLAGLPLSRELLWRGLAFEILSGFCGEKKKERKKKSIASTAAAWAILKKPADLTWPVRFF